MPIKKLSAETLRKHKGLSFTGVVTTFICHDGKGKIFMSQRSKNTRDEHGRWDTGAGGLKHGFTVEGNIRRELKEEYDAEPIKLEFLGYFDVFRNNDDGQLTHWLDMVFAVLVDPQQVKINEPDMVDDSGWFSLDAMPQPIHSELPEMFKKFDKQLRKITKQSA